MDRMLLYQVKDINKHIEEKMERLTTLRALAEGGAIQYDRDPVQTSSRQDRLESIVAQIVDLESEIDRLVDILVKCKRDGTEVIDCLSKERYRDVLYNRYMLCMTVRKTAKFMDRSEIWVKKTTKEAMREYDEIK